MGTQEISQISIVIVRPGQMMRDSKGEFPGIEDDIVVSDQAATYSCDLDTMTTRVGVPDFKRVLFFLIYPQAGIDGHIMNVEVGRKMKDAGFFLPATIYLCSEQTFDEIG
jgi:hypothetical protein